MHNHILKLHLVYSAIQTLDSNLRSRLSCPSLVQIPQTQLWTSKPDPLLFVVPLKTRTDLDLGHRVDAMNYHLEQKTIRLRTL
jgi:hypothetical protein